MPAPFSRPPHGYRRGIPLFYEKSEDETRRDVYERYAELVTRQTALHLADRLHAGYPFQPLLAYLHKWLPEAKGLLCADAGCSVGRIAAEIGEAHPTWEVWGFDLSYQMVRQANDYWKVGTTLQPNLTRQGWGTPNLTTTPRANVHFALAKAEDLPFPNRSVDVLVNTFLLDRVPNPTTLFAEFQRVLKPGARLITASPPQFPHPHRLARLSPPHQTPPPPNANGLVRPRLGGPTHADRTDGRPRQHPALANGRIHPHCSLTFRKRH